jgi:hypothetical protein
LCCRQGRFEPRKWFPRERVNRRSASGGRYSEAVKRSARVVASAGEDRTRKAQEGVAFQVGFIFCISWGGGCAPFFFLLRNKLLICFLLRYHSQFFDT